MIGQNRREIGIIWRYFFVDRTTINKKIPPNAPRFSPILARPPKSDRLLADGGPSKSSGSGSFFARFNAVLLAGLGLLVLLGVLAVSSVDQLVASAEEENLAQGRLTAVEEFVGKLERVGATVTRYLVEGTPARFSEYAVGKEAALAAFEALTAKVATDPAQTERLARINKLMRLRFIEQDRLVRLIRERAPLPPHPTVGLTTRSGQPAAPTWTKAWRTCYKLCALKKSSALKRAALRCKCGRDKPPA